MAAAMTWRAPRLVMAGHLYHCVYTVSKARCCPTLPWIRVY